MDINFVRLTKQRAINASPLWLSLRAEVTFLITPPLFIIVFFWLLLQHAVAL